MSSANERIFRAAAIERISSPEQLDQLVRIARPFDWAAAFAIGLVLIAVVVWSLVGRIATQTPGDGILIIGGGQVVDAVSAAAGRLDSMSVAVNDRVSRALARGVRQRVLLPHRTGDIEQARDDEQHERQQERELHEGLTPLALSRTEEAEEAAQ